VFAVREDGRYELTPLAQPLRSGVLGSQRMLVLLHGQDLYPVAAALLHSVQTGTPAFDQVYGMPNWEYRKQHPEVNARYNAGVAEVLSTLRGELVAAYPFPDTGLVVDVGGGDGTLLAAILASHPGLRGILFDQPHVVEAAGPKLAAAGVASRVTVVGGDFFVGVPTGGDVYLLSGVLHDWGDDRGIDILVQCRRAMGPDARLLLVEQVLTPGNAPSPVKYIDIAMLLTNAGGRERELLEWQALLEAGGFTFRQRTGAGVPHSSFEVLEATPR
jgi:hypothetical protein